MEAAISLRKFILHAGTLPLALFAAGCAGDQAGEFLVRPGLFDYYDCPKLARSMESAVRREQDLKILIDRAEKDALGAVIAIGSYRGEYLRAQAEQKMAAEVSARKNCAAVPPPSPPPAAPAPVKRR